jgi:triphosphatase
VFAVFRTVMNETSCTAIKEELRWITGVLGAARDLDVFTTQTLPPILNQLKSHPGLQQLSDKAIEAQCQAYVDARAAISSQRYHRFLLSLGGWLENERWRSATPPADGCTVLDIAQATLARRYKQLRRHGRRLTHMHPEERHATRIAAKKLRYAAEFFSSLHPARMTRPFSQGLAQLQDILGVLNDIAVTENLIRQLIGNHPVRALDESLHIFAGWNACEAMHRLEVMESTWRSFKKTRPFWN